MSRLFYSTLFYYIFSVIVSAATPAQVIRKAESVFLNAKTVAAEFKLTIRWQLRDTVEEKSGKITIKNPGKYRVELGNVLFISDGKAFFRYSGRNKQLVINDIVGARSKFQPGEWLFKYSDQYRPLSMARAVLFGEKCSGVTMVPKDKARFKKLKAWISDRTNLPRKIETTDKNDNTATYLITAIRKDVKVGNALFRFSPPKGTEIIDMRE